MESKQEFKRQYFKKSYEFECPKCKKELWAKPSMMMTQFGINSGHGTCLDCKTFFHLEIAGGINGKKMIAEIWDDWLKKQHEAGI